MNLSYPRSARSRLNCVANSNASHLRGYFVKLQRSLIKLTGYFYVVVGITASGLDKIHILLGDLGPLDDAPSKTSDPWQAFSPYEPCAGILEIRF